MISSRNMGVHAIEDRRLRFCMITTFYPPYNFGGDGIAVYHLANELARRGHHVEVVHCLDAYQLLARRKPADSYVNHLNVIVHQLKSPFGFLSPLASHQTGYPLFKAARIKQILNQSFDVIHYHNISLLGPKVLELGKGLKLYTLHEFWLICATHALFRFNRAPCVRPHCILCTLSYKRPPQLWRYLGLIKKATRHVDIFIAPSGVSLYKHQQMGLQGSITHIPNFVPLTEDSITFPDAGVASPEEGPYFLFVGRLEKLKGLQAIIPIFRNYLKAKLLIAGAGSLEPELKYLAGDSSNIKFMGFVSGRRLQLLYRQALAVIYPAINYQGFAHLPRGDGAPLVIMEAFGQQTPVIAKDLGTIPVLIRKSGSGLVYSTDAELIAAMDHLVTSPASRDSLGRNGHEVYKQTWTIDAHLKRYFALIHETLSARGIEPDRRHL